MIWKTDAPIVKNPLGTGWSFTFMITERVGALASPDIYLINSYKDGHYQAFAARDGSILWGAGHGRTEQKPPGRELSLGKLNYPILADGKIIDRDGGLLDPLTGKPTRRETAHILRRLRFMVHVNPWRPWNGVAPSMIATPRPASWRRRTT